MLESAPVHRMAIRYLDNDPPRTDDPLLAQLVGRLVDVYHPERVYLFGSVARGDASPDSDYDLMVVVPDEAPPELQSSKAACAVLWELRMPADVHVLTRHRFDRQLHLRASLPSTVLREGKLLHAA